MAKDSKIRNEHPYFFTLTVVGWTDFFIRREYSDILFENLRFCQREKGLEIHSYCLMTSHLHMIVSSLELPLAETIRNFKSYTGKVLLKALAENPSESRKAWLESRFTFLANVRSKDTGRQFWERDNYPEPILGDKFYRQKEVYIHRNPVEAGFVLRPEDWFASSACPDGPLEITPIW